MGTMIHFGEIVNIVAEQIVAHFKVITRHSYEGSEKIPQ
jgi:hypothetical protein